MKNIVKIAFVAAFAAIAGYGVYTSQKTEVMSDLALANVEALAEYEIPEVEINCGKDDGKCWIDDGYEYVWTPFGGFRVTSCKFSGYIWTSCYSGLPV